MAHAHPPLIATPKLRRIEQVRLLLANGKQPQAVFAQQWVRSSRKDGEIVVRTKAITATGHTPGGDAMAATYVADWRAALGSQIADGLRFVTNSIFLKEGESSVVFGWVHPWHVLEANCFRRAEFEEVRSNKVATSALRAVRNWTRGKEVVWLRLPAVAASRVAAELRSKVAVIEELEDCIMRAQAKGLEPDPRIVRRCRELRVGLDAYWFFIEGRWKVESEPAVEATGDAME